MARLKTTYKARISNHVTAYGQVQAHVHFGHDVDIGKVLGCTRMKVEIRGSRLVFIPDGNTAKKTNCACTQRLTLRALPLAKHMAQFDGEYYRLTKQEDGSVSIDIADKRPIKAQCRKQGPTAEKVTPTVNSRAAITAISQEAREKIKRLDKDIEEAKKMLEELLDERKKEEFILENAGNLLNLLGG